MLPGLVPPAFSGSPHHHPGGGGAGGMLPLLQQAAWLSSRANSLPQLSAPGAFTAAGIPTPSTVVGGFPFPPHPLLGHHHPGLVASVTTAASSHHLHHHHHGLLTTTASSARGPLSVSPPILGAGSPSFSAGGGSSPTSSGSDDPRRPSSDHRLQDVGPEPPAKRGRAGSGADQELICPVCSIAVRSEDLPDHFLTEIKCLDNIRSLSPIAVMRANNNVSRSSSADGRRSMIGSPHHHHHVGGGHSSLLVSPKRSPNSSMSPSSNNNNNNHSPSAGSGILSAGFLENRWERFERIRNKRRERIGVKERYSARSPPTSAVSGHSITDIIGRRRSRDNNADHHGGSKEDNGAAGEDIDIGEEDSLSDCGSGAGGGRSAAAATETSDQTMAGNQYTEADVLRCLKKDEDALGGGGKRREDSVYGDEEDEEDVAEDGAGNRYEEEKRMRVSDNDNNGGGGMRCPSCREGMQRPVLNVGCWHLKCEHCWLRAVGTSKQCRICSAAASVRDLRKVFV